GIPADERIENYITHVFEADIKAQLEAKHPLSIQMLKAIDDRGPKTIFNPFLQERLGATTGLIRNPFIAARAYNARALRTFYYQPLLDRLEVYRTFAPPAADRYLKGFAERLTGAPSAIDQEINTSIRNLVQGLNKFGPQGQALAKFFNQGNAAGMAAYNLAGGLYIMWLGFKPTTAIRNLSQQMLAMAEVGPLHFGDALRLRFTKEGKAALKESLVLQSRAGAFIAGLDSEFVSTSTESIKKVALFMFQRADKENVMNAFLSGYSEAKSLFPDADRSLWLARGDEVAADTQFLYTKLNAASWSQNAPGRVGAMLTTWMFNFMELLNKWVQAKPSQVYLKHEAATGQAAPKKNWSQTRQSILMYMLIAGLAFKIQDETKLKATEYVGITSLNTLANLVSGDFPALEIPGALVKVAISSVTGDDRMMQEGLNELNPIGMLSIANQLEAVAEGRKDWVSLFFYQNFGDPQFAELKEKWAKQIDAYNELETSKERTEAREQSFFLDGRLFIIGQTKTLLTEDSRRYVLNQIEEHNLDTDQIPGYEKVFGIDSNDPLNEAQLRIGDLEELVEGEAPVYFTTQNFSTGVNTLVRQQGRFKVTEDGHKLAIQYLEDKDTWQPYFNFDRDTDEGRGAARLYRKQFPSVEASLYFWGEIESFLNPESATLVLEMMDEFNIPPQGIRAFRDDPSKFDDLLTPLFDLKKATFELDTQFDEMANAASELFLPSIPDKDDPEYENGREFARAKLKDDNPEWVADKRRIEALQNDATDEVADAWVDRGRKADEFSAGSPEASLAMADDLDTYRWALDEGLLTDDGGLPDGDPRLEGGRRSAQWNIPVLRLDVKWREQDDLYGSYSDPDSDNFIPADETILVDGEEVDKREQVRALLLAGNEEYRQDRRRREAFQRDIPTDLIENYVDYYEEEAIGFRRERLLVEVEGLAEALELDKPDFVPDAKFDDLREQWTETLATYADVDEDDKAAFMIANKDFHLAKLEMDAYMLGFKPELAPSYVKYYRLLAEGRPDDWLVQESYHEPIWTLMENPDFWNRLKELRRAIDPAWGKELEERFATTPSRKVYALLIGYYDRRGIKARDNYRWELVNNGETGLED
ncbi:hypothetical protein LCGC14_1610630, partial [marine sediment metagenome]